MHNNPLILFDPYGLNAIDIACDFSYGFVEGAAQGAFYAACGTLITSYEVACFAVDTVRDPMASYQKTCNLANEALDIARGLDWHTVKEGVISYAHDTYNQTLEMDAHDFGKTLGQAAGSRLVSSYTGGGSKWRLSSKDKGAATKAATSKGKGKIGQLQQNSQPLKNTASQAAKGNKNLVEVSNTSLNKINPRITPKNLSEKLALDEAKANVGNEILKGKIKDDRYPAEQWAKKEHVHRSLDGYSKIDIHYWEERGSGRRHGFKFKDY